MSVVEVQGVQVPATGFGTWELTGGQAIEGTRHALELGYRQIDTPQIYGNQVPYQPGRTENTLLGIAAEHDVMITAYSPLRGQGVQSPFLAELEERG